MTMVGETPKTTYRGRFVVVRRPEGAFHMIEINDYVPNPLAPSFLVNKVGGIYRVTKNLMKCTLVLASPGRCGIQTAIERVSLLWEHADMYEANDICHWVLAEMQRGTFVDAIADDGGGRMPRTQ